ncbi:uncharacterized protein BXZ73DRAFT_105590 [Epithele typhae]|uniref:uncharacterized protein n=1 Tax=Epithele typhae TaxID=378194 RepID=UPI0020074D53|nr:uncharacterized protein BXZ73DRAFT_105590 [Epithele typhae]KAH9917112.1 hypothetical protein BXZ73DRAFT_105590 [Epithele typhae]
MTPVELNVDVLEAILSYLSGKDAFHAALCSSQFYTLAYPLAFSAREGYWPMSTKIIRTLHQPENSNTNRSSFLRRLSLNGIDRSLYSILVGHLLNARKMHTLQLTEVDSIFSADERAFSALKAMLQLTHLTLLDIGKRTLQVLSSIRAGKLSTLKLRFISKKAPDQTFTITQLLSSLSASHELRALEPLEGWEAWITGSDLDTPVPPLPRLQHLRVISTLPSVFLWSGLQYFPHLSSLQISRPLRVRGHVHPSDAPVWPSLQELHLPGWIDLSIIDSTGFRVQHLHVGADYRITVSSQNLCPDQMAHEALITLIQDVLTRALTLYLVMPLPEGSKTHPGGNFWKDLGTGYTALRSLNLRLTSYDLSQGPNYAIVAATLPTALSSLRLYSFHLDAPRMEWWRAYDIRLCPPGVPVLRWVADVVESDVDRLRMLHSLPGQLVDAIPTLRVLGVGTCLPALHPDRGKKGWEGFNKKDLVDLEESEARKTLREMGETNMTREQRWWIVDRQAAPAKMVEIWREDGERARDMVESEGFDASMSFDEFYSDRCRYMRTLNLFAVQVRNVVLAAAAM